MDSDECKLQQLEALEAQIRDQRRLGGPTGALQHSRDKLLASLQKAASEAQRRASLQKAASEAQRRARSDLLQEERWHREHYHRRST